MQAPSLQGKKNKTEHKPFNAFNIHLSKRSIGPSNSNFVLGHFKWYSKAVQFITLRKKKKLIVRSKSD